MVCQGSLWRMTSRDELSVGLCIVAKVRIKFGLFCIFSHVNNK